mgnify:CR=1 FL=1
MKMKTVLEFFPGIEYYYFFTPILNEKNFLKREEATIKSAMPRPTQDHGEFELKKEESMGIKNFSSIYGDRPGQIDNSELEGVNE